MPAAGKALRFTHVYLRNWRNFVKVGVGLERRAFLVGPNASGKSNLLDVFRFLHDLVSIGGGFQESLRKRGGVSRLRCLAARQQSDLVVHVRIGTGGNVWAREYELHFNQGERERPMIRRERVAREGVDLVDRPDESDQGDPERLTQTYVEQVNVNREFREVADFFRTVRYLHVVPQLVREPDRSAGRRDDPYGGDFLEQIARTAENVQKARLRRILEALRTAVPQLVELELWRDARGAPHLRGRYEHWRPHGAWQTEDQFSDGTLRLVGLLWAALDGHGPLLLEEPELSLHPEVVRYIPPMLARIQHRSGRQVMLSTHSTVLLEDEGISVDEVLLLEPGEQGTTARVAGESGQIRALLEGGATLPQAVMPETAPEEAEQLGLFGV
jgi:predicted ATPase